MWPRLNETVVVLGEAGGNVLFKLKAPMQCVVYAQVLLTYETLCSVSCSVILVRSFLGGELVGSHCRWGVLEMFRLP